MNGLHPTNQVSDLLAALSDLLAALSDPLRLRLCAVLQQQELNVGEAAHVFQLPQSTVSRHLKALIERGWLQKRSDGTAAYYRLTIDDLPDANRKLWLALREQVSPADPKLAEELARLDVVVAQRRTDSLAYFGRVVEEWDAVRSELFGDAFTRAGLLALLPREWVVADFGCGTGAVTECLAPHVREVVAIDASAPMLAAARTRLKNADNVRFVEASATETPLEDGCVDVAVCMLLLHHLEKPVTVLREARRVVRQGGLVLIVDMFAHQRTEYRTAMGHKQLGFAPAGLSVLCSQAGFTVPWITPLPTSFKAKGPALFSAVAGTA